MGINLPARDLAEKIFPETKCPITQSEENAACGEILQTKGETEGIRESVLYCAIAMALYSKNSLL